MLAIARALARDIKVLLLDEPYEGLAPVIVQEIAKTLSIIRDQGITTIIVEQNAVAALKLADRAVILDTGTVVYDDSAQKVLDDEKTAGAIPRHLTTGAGGPGTQHHIQDLEGPMLETQNGMYLPTEEFASNAHADKAKYDAMYARSVEDPEGFWGDEGKRIDWIKPYTKVKNTSFEPGKIDIRWFEDGTLNVAANCIDRHLETRADQTAIIWEPDSADDPARHITYRELHENVCKFANVLKKLGVGKGDRVVLYMPMIPEAAYAMLASARIGAIHSIVFAGFSADALGARRKWL